VVKESINTFSKEHLLMEYLNSLLKSK